MRWPVDKVFITQGHGENPDIYDRFGFKGHNGVDLRIFNKDGDRDIVGPIYAPHDGEVVEKWTDSDGYGKYLKIENDKEGSILAHLNERYVNRGERVEEGQLIAEADNTGWSTGSHLHWGYYRKPRDKNNGYGGTIDPAQFINQNNQMDDIRLKLLNEAGVETEGDLRAVLGSHKDIDNVKKDLQNTKESLERLRGEYKDLKDDLKRDVEAYETRLKEEKKRYDNAIATIAKEIGSSQDIPSIMEEVTRLRNDSDQKEEKRQEAIEHQERVLTLKKEIERLRDVLESERQANGLLEDKVKDLIATVTTLERQLSINEKEDMAKQYPVWKKALWDAWRAFGVAFLSVVVIRLQSGINLDKPIDWLINVLSAALAGGFSALARLLREDKDYKNLLYKLPF